MAWSAANRLVAACAFETLVLTEHIAYKLARLYQPAAQAQSLRVPARELLSGDNFLALPDSATKGGLNRFHMRIVIVTSIHPVLDKRVFQRHALLLQGAGHEVHLIAPSDVQRSERNGVVIHGFPRPANYTERLFSLPSILRLAISLHGDIYHLHDPDLLAIGWCIRSALGVPVVYDAHEDFSVERRVLGFSPRMSRSISGAVGHVERFFARRLDAVVCPHIIRLRELRHPAKPALFLPNYPPRNVFDITTSHVKRHRSLVYAGLLSLNRGAELILDAATRMPDVTFLLLARFMVPAEDAYFSAELARRRLPNVEYRGFVPFAEMPVHLGSAGVGIMPWRRTPQHLRAAQPSKLYEYMACRLPVLASDLPITRQIVDGNNCGRLHAADDLEGFVSSAYAILDDPSDAAAMGERGRRAFEAHYSYESAGQELIVMYEKLLADRRGDAGRERSTTPTATAFRS